MPIATRLADLRDMLLAAAAVLLAYFIVSAGIAGALEPTRPEASARWWPGFADAGAVADPDCEPGMRRMRLPPPAGPLVAIR